MAFSPKLLVLAALLALGGCAAGFPAQVSRFQQMPTPAGESFAIEPADPADRGGLEFSRYADLVRRHLLSLGYGEAPSAGAATLLASLDYGIVGGRRSFIDVDIRRTADGRAVFEGTAEALSADGDLKRVVPNLVEALFTGFPGNSGETVRITLAPPPKPARR